MVKTLEKSVLEKYLFESPHWKESYKEFAVLFGRPLGWLYVIGPDEPKLIRLDRKGNCAFYAKSAENEASCISFLIKHFGQLADDPESAAGLPNFYRCAFGKSGAVFPLKYLGRLRGFLVLDEIDKSRRAVKPFISIFERFLQAEVELAYRTFELQNFYETVHPRALALSTIHSVHRVMASSSGLNELLPRVGRLCAQVLKAKRCDLFLVDKERRYLELKFSLGESGRARRRLRLGRGMEGHVAESAEFHKTRACIAVPLIEEDVLGVIVLKDKIDNTSFTTTDLEILKTLSEQSVIAIKNAQLFEETQRLTIGSIKTINELLELSFAGDNIHLPLFGEIAFRVGRDLRLSEDELTNLHRATFLIDAGQMGAPGQIIQKREVLTAREYEVVRQHPLRGAEILKQISSLQPAIPIILHHHERFDGKGYPSGLKGDEIPIGGRIVAVVDSFTAMVSKRPYRKVRTVKEAVREIKSNAGAQFDPKVVDSFLRVVQDVDIASKLRTIEEENFREAKNFSPAQASKKGGYG